MNLRMTLQDIDGNYYSAKQNTDSNGWTIAANPDLSYIKALPNGWDATTVTWERNTNYMGVFRSQTDVGYKWSEDARAILQSIKNTKGVQGYCLLTIYIANGFLWDIFYTSEFDFTSYSDNMLTQQLQIATLDNGLIREIKAYGDTKFNIPIWVSDGSGGWLPNDAVFIYHQGIKLLYNATFVSSATPDNLLIYDAGGAAAIGGFNHGRHGGAPTTAGFHTIPFMSPYNPVQNNGATTYIGNTILQPFLPTYNQNNSVDGDLPGEEIFNGANDSRPYNSNNCMIKDLLQNGTGTVEMSVNISAIISGSIAWFTTSSPPAPFLGFVLFEIDNLDNPTPDPITGEFSYIPIYKLPLGTGGPYAPINVTTNVTLKYNKAYIFCLVYDDDTVPQNQLQYIQTVKFSQLQVSFLSNFDYGSSGVPIPAPSLNPTIFPGFKPYPLLQKLVKYLATINTDSYGFPVLIDTPYSGDSSFLSPLNLTPVGDVVPTDLNFTSAYCIHDLQGQSYVTLSLNQFFNFWKKQFGCGMGIEGNVLKLEQPGYFFQNVMILDLGFDVTDFEIETLVEGLGSNLKLGYTKQDTNSNFGVEPANTELYFNTPLSNIPGTMDYQETDILTEQYAAEIARAQQTSQPVGTSFDPANPSSDNPAIALYCFHNATVDYSPSTDPAVIDPNNNLLTGVAFPVRQRNGLSYGGPANPAAQSTDPTASTAPYIKGLYYPDTAINVELSPCRALERGAGALLHSVLDLMDDQYLTFRNTSVMQYNNVTLNLSGISSNLEIGAGATPINEFSDKLIGDLPAQLFRPIVFKVKSRYPVNMYNIFNTPPYYNYGYVRFFWKNKGFGDKEYKGFISKVSQNAGSGAPTEFTLWATPDMVL